MWDAVIGVGPGGIELHRPRPATLFMVSTTVDSWADARWVGPNATSAQTPINTENGFCDYGTSRTLATRTDHRYHPCRLGMDVRGCAAIVLAAGASRRMGVPKAQLAWGNSTLLRHAIDEARLAGAEQVVVVLGSETQHVSVDATTVVNLEPDTGRSASIRLGAAALCGAPSAIVVQSVDQPVAHTVLENLCMAVRRGAEVAVPTFRGRRGHPVCVAGTLISELLDVNEATLGLRAVIRRHAVTEVPCEDEAVVWNLNDPAAYEAARPPA